MTTSPRSCASARYIKDKNAAGVIIWEISQDRWQGRSVLLEVIGNSFLNR